MKVCPHCQHVAHYPGCDFAALSMAHYALVKRFEEVARRLAVLEERLGTAREPPGEAT